MTGKRGKWGVARRRVLCYVGLMTKLDLALARIARLPPDRQEAIAAELEFLLDGEESGESLLTDEQWAEVQRRLQDVNDPLLSHEEVVRSLQEAGD